MASVIDNIEKALSALAAGNRLLALHHLSRAIAELGKGVRVPVSGRGEKAD